MSSTGIPCEGTILRSRGRLNNWCNDLCRKKSELQKRGEKVFRIFLEKMSFLRANLYPFWTSGDVCALRSNSKMYFLQFRGEMDVAGRRDCASVRKQTR